MSILTPSVIKNSTMSGRNMHVRKMLIPAVPLVISAPSYEFSSSFSRAFKIKKIP